MWMTDATGTDNGRCTRTRRNLSSPGRPAEAGSSSGGARRAARAAQSRSPTSARTRPEPLPAGSDLRCRRRGPTRQGRRPRSAPALAVRTRVRTGCRSTRGRGYRRMAAESGLQQARSSRGLGPHRRRRRADRDPRPSISQSHASARAACRIMNKPATATASHTPGTDSSYRTGSGAQS